MSPIKNNKHCLSHAAGFTLIEMIITISILAIVSVIASGFLFSSVSSGGKTEIGKEARQNGNYALSVMQGMILNSKTVACPTPVGKRVDVTDMNGKLTSFICDDSTNYKISSVSARNYDLTGDNVAVSGCNFTCEITPGKPSLVKIEFTVSQVNQTGVTPKPNESASLNFKTQVLTKNY